MIIFHDQISKSNDAHDLCVERIGSLIKDQEPEIIEALVEEWEKQQRYFTYKDLEKGILDGSITNSMLATWRESYTQFVSNRLAPMWQKAMNEAAKPISNKYASFIFDPTSNNIKNWTAQHSGEFIVQITDTQLKGINSIIQMAATTGMNVDELARCIRPTVGLYAQQVTANFNYYQTIKNNLMQANPTMREKTAKKRAAEKALKYAKKQHRYRAMNIARTELAFAYNHGEYESVKQAVQQGFMGHTVKRWISAGDSRVCANCQLLEGEEAELDDIFNTKSKGDRLTPPAHPSCRCSVEYYEIEAPKKNTVNTNMTDETSTAQTFDEILEQDETSSSTARTFNEILGQNNGLTNNNQIKRFTSIVENYNNLPDDIQTEINDAFDLLPARHRDIILSEINKVIISQITGSHYHPINKIVNVAYYPDNDFDEIFNKFELIHELGHAIETNLDLFDNPEFMYILRNGIEDIGPSDFELDDNFISIENGYEVQKTITKLNVSNSKFISEYQRRVYNEDSYEIIINNEFNFRLLKEYFSEGYREYFENPENLKTKDIKLYKFIKGL